MDNMKIAFSSKIGHIELAKDIIWMLDHLPNEERMITVYVPKTYSYHDLRFDYDQLMIELKGFYCFIRIVEYD